jgi:rRNA maturation protein Nop10
MSDTTIPVSKSLPFNNAVKTALVQNQAEAPKQNIPTETVELPSQGYFYPANHPLSSGKIDIYQVTARHEDILSNTNLLKKGTVLDEFLKALIATPNVGIEDLLIGDKNALFIAARKSAYGEIYTTKIKCPECAVESNIEIDLSVLKPKPLNTDGLTKGENRLSFKLPNSGKVVVVSLLTHKDETDIDAELKALAKFNGANNTNSPEITTRLKYTIKAIDGESDRGRIKNFVDTQLTAKDSLALRKFVRENTPDMNMNFDFTCPACGHQAKMTVPLGASFFWPNLTEN